MLLHPLKSQAGIERFHVFLNLKTQGMIRRAQVLMFLRQENLPIAFPAIPWGVAMREPTGTLLSVLGS